MALFLMIVADPNSTYPAGTWPVWDALFAVAAAGSLLLLVEPTRPTVRGWAVATAVMAMFTRASILVVHQGGDVTWALAVWPTACTAYTLLAAWSWTARRERA